MAKSERKKLVEALDSLASKLCRSRVGGICEHCGKEANQAHHYFGRRKYSTRWEMDNLVSLCWACHRYWAHPDYESCRDYLISRIGQERFDELKLQSNQPGNFKVTDLRDMKETLKRLLNAALTIPIPR